MTAPIELLYARVKYPANAPRETKNGLRINVLLELPDGTEQKLWGDPGDPLLTPLKKGQQVQVAKDHKGVKLVGGSAPHSPALSTQSPAIGQPSILESEEGRGEIKKYVKWQAKLLRQCYQETLKQFCTADENGEVLVSPSDSESVRSLAVNLYISTQRKFNL